MGESMPVVYVSAMVALAAAVLVWMAVGVSTQAWDRYRQTFHARARFSLSELFLAADPDRLLRLTVALSAFGGLLAWAATGRPVLGLAAALALSGTPRWAFMMLRKRRNARIEAQLPGALLLMAGSLRAGLSLAATLQHVAEELPPPFGQECALMLREQRLGLALDESLANLGRRLPLVPIQLAVSALRIALESGGSVAETLERVAHSLREQQAMEGKIRALTAQGKLQAWVVGCLPLALAAALAQLEPEAMALLFTAPIGWGVLAAVALLEMAGLLLIRKIARVDV